MKVVFLNRVTFVSFSVQQIDPEHATTLVNVTSKSITRATFVFKKILAHRELEDGTVELN